MYYVIAYILEFRFTRSKQKLGTHFMRTCAYFNTFRAINGTFRSETL